MGKIPARIPNYSQANLAKNAEAQGVMKGTTASEGTYLDAIANGATIVSSAITTTKKTLIVVVASILKQGATISAQIQRGGVNKTQGSQASGTDTNGKAQIHLWSWEVLDAGTYTYNLVNTSGGQLSIHGASIKAIAVEA